MDLGNRQVVIDGSAVSTERICGVAWYDTQSAGRRLGPEFDASIADALRYLRLRDRITVHPELDHLVRFV